MATIYGVPKRWCHPGGSYQGYTSSQTISISGNSSVIFEFDFGDDVQSISSLYISRNYINKTVVGSTWNSNLSIFDHDPGASPSEDSAIETLSGRHATSVITVYSSFSGLNIRGGKIWVWDHPNLMTGNVQYDSGKSYATLEYKPVTVSSITPTGTVAGEASIAFSWSVSGGQQASAEIEHSIDGNTWGKLHTITGDGSSFSVAGNYFSLGLNYWRIKVKTTHGVESDWSGAQRFTVSYPAIVVIPSPNAIFTEQKIHLDFENRLGENISVSFKSGSTVLETTKYDGDSLDWECPELWFSKAGESRNTLSVTVQASDSMGRSSANASFTLKKRTGGSVATNTPSGQVLNDSTINFTWSYSGDGELVSTLLEYSDDNAVWKTLATVDGGKTLWECPAFKFVSGSYYWRGTAINSLGATGSPSSGRSFSVRYPALVVIVRPDTIFTGESVSLSFDTRLDQTLNIGFYYGNIRLDDGEISASGDSLQVSCPPDWFTKAGATGSSMSVTVRATDPLGRTSADTRFTLKKRNGSTATPRTPSGQVNGADQIPFTWDVSEDYGAQTAARLEWSSDAVNWEKLAEIDGATQNWFAASAQFPAGAAYWRVKVWNSLGVEGSFSAAKSFTVKYDAVSQTIPVNSPTSGNLNTAVRQTFSVALEASGPVNPPFTIASATLYWRTGTSGEWTTAPMTVGAGKKASASIAAGTIPNGTFQWYGEATDQTGKTTATDVFTLTALTAQVVTTPLRPINVVERNTSPIVFEWSYIALDGSEQRSAELEYSLDGSTWEPLGSALGSSKQYTAAENTFPGGTIAWRVRAYNSGGIAGAWSEPVSFRSFGAPAVTAVTADGKPFLTVTWQTTGQAAYKIEIDGVLQGPYAGQDARSYTVGTPLLNGNHVVRVAAQNEYGLWSEWAEARVYVQNEGSPLQVTASAVGDSIRLNIQADGGAATSTNIITRQPRDVQTTDPALAVFDVGILLYDHPSEFYYSRFGWSWDCKEPGGDWQTVEMRAVDTQGPPVDMSYTVADPASSSGNLYRVTIEDNAGRNVSREALFTYAEPYARSPEIRGYFPPETGYHLIFRDGELIAKTYANSFIDRTANGTHTYDVVRRIEGNFVRWAAEITAQVSIDCPVIGLLSGGDLLRLELSESADREQEISRSGQVSYTWYSGGRFPTAEAGEQEDIIVTGDVSWPKEHAAEAARFEAMLKKPVIYKTPGGMVVVGVLAGYERKDPRWWRSYRFSVRQMDWEGYFDESGQAQL